MTNFLLALQIFEHQKLLPSKPNTNAEWKQYYQWKNSMEELDKSALKVVHEEIYQASRPVKKKEAKLANKYISLLEQKVGIRIDEIELQSVQFADK